MAPNGDRETEKIGMTLSKDTMTWLRETYPDATSDQERLRMAVSDARLLREFKSNLG